MMISRKIECGEKSLIAAVRKSKAEIVQEGLKSIHRRLDEEMNAWLNFKAEPVEGMQELE